MPLIKFNNTNKVKTYIYNEEPVVNISKIVFISEDKNWVQRLSNSVLITEIESFGQDDNFLGSFQQRFQISSFITPYHRQAVFETNLWLKYLDKNHNNNNDVEIKQWKIKIELIGLNFYDPNESLQISIVNKEHILNRISDWKKRVDNLYKDINEWIKEQSNLSIIIGNPIYMYEEQMQNFNINPTAIDTADILIGKNILISFKPKGLWIIGANGRIDIISKFGNFVLVDYAAQFETPKWTICYSTVKKEMKPFNRNEFINILNQMI